MTRMTQTTAHLTRSRSSSKPNAKGVFVDLDMGPSRRAILYWDPEPISKDD